MKKRVPMIKKCAYCDKEFAVPPCREYRKYCSAACSANGRKKRIPKICQACGKDFEVVPAFKDTAKYCSVECGFAGKRKEWITKICQACGEEFKVTPARKDTARFCSRVCADKGLSLERRGKNNPAWTGGKVKIRCETCGKELEFFRGRAKEQRFCSHKCFAAWWSQQQQGESNTCWRDAKSTRICEVCGKVFEKYVYEDFPGRFCSRECAVVAQAGPGNPNWRGGKSFEPYPPTFNEAFKKKIRQRDSHTCAICKLPGRSVHHINYVKEDTVPENCITLCRPCHMVTNFNRDYWLVAMTNLQEARVGVEL